MSSRTLLLTFSVLSALLGTTRAQITVPVPLTADLAEGHHSMAMPFGVEGFRTQLLVSAAALATNGGVLTGIRFRGDRTATPLAATLVPNVTVQISQTTTTVGNLNPQFALNVTGTPTTVFQGTVTLPGYPESYAGPLSWDIVIPFSSPFSFTTSAGDLLLDIVGNNPAQQLPVYWLDGMQGGGAATPFGRAGDNPSNDFLNLVVSTGNSLEPRLISPGHTLDFASTLFFSPAPGVLALGIAALPTPLDLGLIGAPTHSLYIDPLLLSAHSWTQSFLGWYSTQSLAIPNNPLLIGERLYAQSAIFDPAANPLGILTSGAFEVRIGDQAEQFAMQQLDADDPAAASGLLVDFGFGQPEFGSTPILVEGVFF